MKKFSLTFITISMFITAFGQGNPNRYNAVNFNPNVDSIAEALVGLAMNNASIKNTENNASYNEYLYRKDKTMWFNTLILQANVNEYSINQGSLGGDPLKQSTQYPRYNIGLIVPVGIFFGNPKQTKADFYRYQSALDQVNMERQSVRREVLITYQEYLMNKKLIDLQQEVVHDYEVIYEKNNEKFTKGQITLESYNYSSMMYHNELTKQVTMMGAVKVAEAKLEALIGMNINDALNMLRQGQLR